jgi:hypothetical protein
MSDVVDIAEEQKKHEDEWLLFEVTDATEDDLPVKGRLLFHSKSRDEVHEVAMRNLGKDLMTAFAGEPVPPDMYVVL